MKKLWSSILVVSLIIIVGISTNSLANEESQVFSAKSMEITKYNQAPMFDDMVENGELPPLEERLPSDPVVVNPLEKVGKYGGTWNRVHTDDEMGAWKSTTLWAAEGFFKYPRKSINYLIPNLATWEWNEEKTEVVFNFKEGVKWSDGHEFTVDDFLFWWEDMILDDRVPYTPPVGTYVGDKPMEVTKIDDYTLKFEYAKTNPLALRSFNRFDDYWSLVPKHYLKQFHPEYNSELKDEEVDELIDRFDNRHQYPGMPTLTAWRPVEWEAGEKAVFERNPYYFKVDNEGNQLPYIDRVVSRRVNDMEMQILKALEGDIDFQARSWEVQDIPLLLENEEKGNYRVIMWDGADSAWPMLLPGYDYPDEKIREIIFNQNFRQALSFAIDRERINEIVALGLAEPHVSPTIEKNPAVQTPEGKKVYEEWENSWTGHKPEKAKELLDEMGMVDKNGDGWRERPDGEDFEFIVTAGTGETRTIDALDLIKEDWEEIGIKTVINPLSGTALQNKRESGDYMIQAWSGSTFCSIFMAPAHFMPVRHVSYGLHPQAALYYQTGGKEGVAPRRDYFKKMQDLYDEAMFTADDDKRIELELEIYRLHLKHGPLLFSTIAKHPSPVVVNKNLKNVSDYGIMAASSWNFPGGAGIEQFYFEE